MPIHFSEWEVSGIDAAEACLGSQGFQQHALIEDSGSALLPRGIGTSIGHSLPVLLGGRVASQCALRVSPQCTGLQPSQSTQNKGKVIDLPSRVEHATESSVALPTDLYSY